MTNQPTFIQSYQRRAILSLLIALSILSASLFYRFGGDWLNNDNGKSQSAKAPVALRSASQAAVEQLEMRIQRNPDNAENYAGLGLSLLQQVRESGDTTLYGRAAKALDKAVELDNQSVDALLGQGMLAAAMHDFAKALQWTERAWLLNPYKAETLGVKVDALVELGRYDEAVATLQQMVDLRPDLGSYSRISYLRELHGDVEGAIEAMHMAVESAPPGSESWLWTLTHMGNLYINRGDLNNAEQIYQQVLQVKEDYPYALAGIARVKGAQGDVEDAIATLLPLSERLPLPEFLTLLGELYEVNGNSKAASQQYELVEVIQQLNAAAGMNVDLEMALFNANHGRDALAAVAQARSAYAVRPTIYGADALAWALYKAGDFVEAKQYSEASLKLKTQDALLYFHAGMIDAALGNSEAARQNLRQAGQINPYFSLLDGPAAQQTLERLDREKS